MKISKLYANNDDFKTIIFDKGINFILADNNGVGKTSLFKLIDFCLLGDKHFLGQEYFKDYIFYIELQIASNRYMTIKRPTKSGKNIELKITKGKSYLTDEKDFNKKGSLGIAKSFFENKVNYSINKFRTYITYFLRDESNQNNAFILNKHASAHEIEYKTLVSNLVGIDGRKIRKKFELDEIIKKEDIDETTLKTAQDDLSKVIEENKTLINSRLIDRLKDCVSKYGNIILNKEYCDSSSFDISPGNFIEIEIKDTGKGISKEYKDKIFEPFFTTKTAGKGTGLGLSVVYGTITNYGGSITVDSKENQGTNFKILLPTSSKIVTKVEENHKIIKGEGTILLVDDEEIIRITTRNILKDMGYKVILAKDGLEAIKIYSKRAKEIDLIITDMIMPKMNGSDLFHKIKIINPNCPIIMVSGFVKDEDIYELKNIGFSGFLYKPYGYSNLSKVISKVLLENKDLKANIL